MPASGLKPRLDGRGHLRARGAAGADQRITGWKSSPSQRGNFSLRLSSSVDRRKMATYAELRIGGCGVKSVQTGLGRR